MSIHPCPFLPHLSLLRFFIARRTVIVERIQAALNAQNSHSPAQLSRQFEDCFFALPDISREHASLRGQLQQAHWADGFQPRDMPGIPNEMFDPADMMARAFNVWRHTRWPGRNGRVRYAQTLFNLYVVRCLALLAMRVPDEGPGASERLAQLQALLDALWQSSPADQPVLVRDVRWLVPVAQSPTTDELGSYLEAARRFEESLDEPDRLEIHKASVLMAGGHLRSQLRHFTMQGRSLDDHALLLSTRGSNALDCAMTIQHLAPLLQSYETAVRDGAADERRTLAGVICQGISCDPELFVNRLDLLGAYSMIEHLFVTPQDGNAALTPMGQQHLGLVQQYIASIHRAAASLLADLPQFRPTPGAYSPYGVMYGFSSNILEHMTLKALQPDAEARFSLEDVFADTGHAAERLAWVSGWRQLPHVPADVLKLYEYPQQFATNIFARIEQALRSAADGGRSTGTTGKIMSGADDAAELATQYVLSSDAKLVAEGLAQPCDPERLRSDRAEGMYLVSHPTPGGWIAISKDVLTDVLGAGQSVRISSLPPSAIRTLQVLHPTLVQ